MIYLTLHFGPKVSTKKKLPCIGLYVKRNSIGLISGFKKKYLLFTIFFEMFDLNFNAIPTDVDGHFDESLEAKLKALVGNASKDDS